MTIRKGISTAVVTLGAYLLASHAQAVAITDASILGAAGAFQSSSAVQSGKGKPKKEHINGFSGIFAGEPWSLLDKTNKPAEPFNDVLFLLSADVRKRSGTWELSSDKPYIPPLMDFLLLLKSGKHWGAYLFEAGVIDPVDQAIGGNFEISWVNKKGRIPKLRYASIYGRLADVPVVTGETPVIGSDALMVVSEIPTPGTDTPPLASDASTNENDTPVDSTSVSPALADIQAVADPNAIPTPGSLLLFVTSLGLALTQLRRKHLS